MSIPLVGIGVPFQIKQLQQVFSQHLEGREIVAVRWPDAPTESSDIGGSGSAIFVLDTGSTFTLWCGVSGADYDEYVSLSVQSEAADFNYKEWEANLSLVDQADFERSPTAQNLTDEDGCRTLIGRRIVASKQGGQRIGLVFQDGAEVRSLAYDTGYVFIPPSGDAGA
ncbi:MAG: hypothetical protein ACPGU1_22920 [Myxococcota bacterium]